MKLQILSDLHLERIPYDKRRNLLEELYTDTEVLVIAGDFLPLINFEEVDRLFSILTAHYPQVWYVPGNHEFYGTSIATGVSFLSKLARFHAKKLTILPTMTSDYFYHGKLKVNGGTGWFIENPLAKALESEIEDFNMISDSKHLYAYGRQFRRDLQVHGMTDILVMHHLPTTQSIPLKYKFEPTNNFYVNNIEDWIFAKKPRLIIHGHTHESQDYYQNDTRIICNPFGYKGSNNNFNPKLVIDIDG